jgi:hypothetical protein
MEFAIPALKGRANPTPITAHRLSGCYIEPDNSGQKLAILYLLKMNLGFWLLGLVWAVVIR